MKALLSLRGFMAPFVRRSVLGLAMLVLVVFNDLAIPRLVERIIDQGIPERHPARLDARSDEASA